MAEYLAATERSHRERVQLLTVEQRQVSEPHLALGSVDTAVCHVGCLLSVGAWLPRATVGVRRLCVQEASSAAGGDGGWYSGAAHQVQQVCGRGGVGHCSEGGWCGRSVEGEV